MSVPSIWEFRERTFSADEMVAIQMRPYRCPNCLSPDTYPVLNNVTTFGHAEPMYITECWIKCSRCHTQWQPKNDQGAPDEQP